MPRRSHTFSAKEIEKLEQIKISFAYLIKNISKKQLNDLMDRFTANYTYNLRIIKNKPLTLKGVKMVMSAGRPVKGGDLRQRYEIRNTRKVVGLIFNKKLGPTHEDIIKMHGILMKDIDKRRGYKKTPNVVSVSKRDLKTTQPKKVKREMAKIIKWYGAYIKNVHPLEMAALFHGKFEHIHPFDDGNGRVGRLLISAILANNGYPPLIIRNSKELAYRSAVRAFENGHPEKLKRFLISKFKKTFREFFEVYAKNKR